MQENEETKVCCITKSEDAHTKQRSVTVRAHWIRLPKIPLLREIEWEHFWATVTAIKVHFKEVIYHNKIIYHRFYHTISKNTTGHGLPYLYHLTGFFSFINLPLDVICLTSPLISCLKSSNLLNTHPIRAANRWGSTCVCVCELQRQRANMALYRWPHNSFSWSCLTTKHLCVSTMHKKKKNPPLSLPIPHKCPASLRSLLWAGNPLGGASAYKKGC